MLDPGQVGTKLAQNMKQKYEESYQTVDNEAFTLTKDKKRTMSEKSETALIDVLQSDAIGLMDKDGGVAKKPGT